MGVTGLALKPVVTPAGAPLSLRVTDWLKPPNAVSVRVEVRVPGVQISRVSGAASTMKVDSSEPVHGGKAAQNLVHGSHCTPRSLGIMPGAGPGPAVEP